MKSNDLQGAHPLGQTWGHVAPGLSFEILLNARLLGSFEGGEILDEIHQILL